LAKSEVFKAEKVIRENRFLAVRNAEGQGFNSYTQKEKALDTALHPEPKLCDLVVTGLSYSIS
jgi:hypothetical protein